MKRVLVIGSGGAGKSTVAAKLGQLIDLEVNQLDVGEAISIIAHTA